MDAGMPEEVVELTTFGQSSPYFSSAGVDRRGAVGDSMMIENIGK
jgi:hypothetical protein